MIEVTASKRLIRRGERVREQREVRELERGRALPTISEPWHAAQAARWNSNVRGEPTVDVAAGPQRRRAQLAASGLAGGTTMAGQRRRNHDALATPAFGASAGLDDLPRDLGTQCERESGRRARLAVVDRDVLRLDRTTGDTHEHLARSRRFLPRE